MTRTLDRTEHARVLQRLQDTPEAARIPPRNSRLRALVGGLDRPLPDRARWILAIAWLALLSLASMVEPATDEPLSALGLAIGLAFFAALFATFLGVASGLRVGAAASLGAAGLFATAVVACPLTDHHSYGAWWLVQAGCAVGLVAASAWALRRG